MEFCTDAEESFRSIGRGLLFASVGRRHFAETGTVLQGGGGSGREGEDYPQNGQSRCLWQVRDLLRTDGSGREAVAPSPAVISVDGNATVLLAIVRSELPAVHRVAVQAGELSERHRIGPALYRHSRQSPHREAQSGCEGDPRPEATKMYAKTAYGPSLRLSGAFGRL